MDTQLIHIRAFIAENGNFIGSLKHSQQFCSKFDLLGKKDYKVRFGHVQQQKTNRKQRCCLRVCVSTDDRVFVFDFLLLLKILIYATNDAKNKQTQCFNVAHETSLFIQKVKLFYDKQRFCLNCCPIQSIQIDLDGEDSWAEQFVHLLSLYSISLRK